MDIYLDNSSTTRAYDEVIEFMAKIMKEDYGNPSSLHDKGLDAEKHMEKAREEVAQSLGCRSEEIIFTSGGTESDNMAIIGGAHAKRRAGNRIITSAIEHPAVLEATKSLEEEGYKVDVLPVDRDGIIKIEDFKKAMREDVILISIMQVNNEVGSIQPIDEIGKLKGNALLHVDMVQGFGKVSQSLKNVDFASISSHKIRGPKGVGAIYIKKGTNIKPIILGGGQERKLRSGTENVPGICGFGLASKMIMENRGEKNEHLKKIKAKMARIFTEELADVTINSTPDGAPHILSVTFENIRGEVILHTLEQDGIFVSTGSACSSNKNEASHVIKAMGRTPKEIEGTLRFSFCDENTLEEIKIAAEKTVEAVNRFRGLRNKRK